MFLAKLLLFFFVVLGDKMKKRKSYSEVISGSDLKLINESTEVNIYVQMIVDEIVIKARIKKLVADIDHALDQRNSSLFQELSKEYKMLMQHV